MPIGTCCLLLYLVPCTLYLVPCTLRAHVINAQQFQNYAQALAIVRVLVRKTSELKHEAMRIVGRLAGHAALRVQTKLN